MLTGRCKTDFEEWLISQNKHIEPNTPWAYLEVSNFNILKLSYKWGVYVDFAYSIDYHFNLQPHLGGGQPVYYPSIEFRNEDFIDCFEEVVWDNKESAYFELEEARKEIIKLFDKLYNEKHFVFPNDLAKEPIKK